MVFRQPRTDCLREEWQTMWVIKLQHHVASNEGGVEVAAGMGEMQKSLIVYLN